MRPRRIDSSYLPTSGARDIGEDCEYTDDRRRAASDWAGIESGRPFRKVNDRLG